jgi:hypothetical protein
MPDEENSRQAKDENDAPAPSTTSFPLKPSGDVVVTHLDYPPPSGPRTIHPRRPAPIVPERNPQSPSDDESKQKS